MPNGNETAQLKEPPFDKSESGSMRFNTSKKARYLEEISDTYGSEGDYWPSFVQLAVMLHAHFPDSTLSIEARNENLTLTLSYDEELLATIDDVRIRFKIDIHDQDWDGIYEGDVFTVAEEYLEDFSRLGYEIYQPSRTYKFGEPIRYKKLLYPCIPYP